MYHTTFIVYLDDCFVKTRTHFYYHGRYIGPLGMRASTSHYDIKVKC